MKRVLIRRVSKRMAAACMLLSLSIIVISQQCAIAQVTASISGRIEDSSGAAVPRATVNVRNLETGVARTLKTGETGLYRALSLPIGQYEVKAEQPGFRTAVQSGIGLAVGQEAVVNLVLEVGEVRQEVVVTGEAPLVNTTTGSVAGLVGEREVKDLPLNGRSFDNLITLNPGTVNFSAMKMINAPTVGLANTFAVSGRRPEENFFLLNGIEYTSSSQQNVTPGGVSSELLGIDAIREFNVLTDTYSAQYGKRAGAQVSIVTASGTNTFHGTVFEFLRNSAVDARSFFDQHGVPPFKRNNFGFSAGGPIQKDKTFFFGNYEGFRQRLAVSDVSVVPDDNARRGLLPDSTHPGQLIDVGLAPGVAPYFPLWPEPNGPSLGDGTALSFSNPKQSIGENFFTTRLDRMFSAQDLLSGVYTFDSGQSASPTTNPFLSQGLRARNQVFSLQEVHTFSPTVINTFQTGFSRGFFNQYPLFSITVPTSLSIVPGQPVPGIAVGGANTVSGTAGLTVGGVSMAQMFGVTVRNLFTYSDQAQITRGSHLISFGVWFQRVQDNALPVNPYNGQAVFSTLKDFLQGNVASITATIKGTELGYRQWEGAWYIQDDLKVTQNLTVNLGLRHEFTNGWNEVAGRNANFIRDANGILLTQPRIADSLFTQNNAVKLFSPRAAVAWDPFGKGMTSIQAGFGMYHDLLDHYNFCCQSNPPFNLGIQLRNVTFPLQIAPGASLPGSLIVPRGIQPDFHAPTVLRYNFKVQQELARNLAISVAYLGSHGYHEIRSVDLNTAIPTICSSAVANCPAGLPHGTKFFPANAQRRNPVLGSSSTWTDAGASNYNSLQIDVTRRFSQGLQFRANYSLSKSIDTGTSLSSILSSAGSVLDPEDRKRDRGLSVYDVRNRFSLSGGYELPIGKGRPFLNTITGVADKLLSGWQFNTVVNLQSGIPFTPAQAANRSRNGETGGGERPSMAPGRTLRGIYLGTPEHWFDATAFALPVAGTYGNVGKSVLSQPGIETVDLSLFKTLPVKERMHLQFRVEAFNLLNRANFGFPNNIVLNPDGTIPGAAGRITTLSTFPRQIQFGLKVLF